MMLWPFAANKVVYISTDVVAVFCCVHVTATYCMAEVV